MTQLILAIGAPDNFNRVETDTIYENGVKNNGRASPPPAPGSLERHVDTSRSRAGALRKPRMRITLPVTALLIAAAVTPAFGQSPSRTAGQTSADQMTELATKLNNPTASLISVPLQSNFDFGGGPDDKGFQYRLNIQPVIPFKLGDDWKLLSRTIVPIGHQSNRLGTGSQSGLGDTSLSLWLSPEKPQPGGVVWGLGSVLLLPTATDSALGAEKWGAGPSAIAVRQSHGWTTGALMNHTWSFAGDSAGQDINSTFLQPFVAFQTRRHTTYGVNAESSYDWNNDQWTVPINLQVTQLVIIGGTPVSFQFGWRYYVQKPAEGPDWGLRLTATLVFR